MITEKQINALWFVLAEYMEMPFAVRIEDHTLDGDRGGQAWINHDTLAAAQAEQIANVTSLFRRALEAAQLAAGPQVAVVQQSGDCTCAASGLLEANGAHEPHCGLQLLGMANFEDAATHMGWLRPRRVWFEGETVPAGANATNDDGMQAFDEAFEASEDWTNHLGTLVESITEVEWEAAVARAKAARYQKRNPA